MHLSLLIALAVADSYSADMVSSSLRNCDLKESVDLYEQSAYAYAYSQAVDGSPMRVEVWDTSGRAVSDIPLFHFIHN
jgi:hypothetical protein